MNGETVDLALLGRMVGRLQSTVDDVRQEYVGIRASLDTMEARFREFAIRMSSQELAQMKLAANMDGIAAGMDRMEVKMEGVEARTEGMGARLEGMEARMGRIEAALDRVVAKIGA